MFIIIVNKEYLIMPNLFQGRTWEIIEVKVVVETGYLMFFLHKVRLANI
jgi:hypothetical protein